MSAKNKFSTKIFIAKTELEATMNTRLDEFKLETVIYIDMKLSAISSNRLSSYYDQHLADLIKWPLLKSPEDFTCITTNKTSIFHDP